MPDLIDRLERKIRRHILAELPPNAPAELETMDLGELLHVYGNWRGRLVAPGPRKVRISDRLRASPDERVDRLARKIEVGVDLTPRLSRFVRVVHHDDRTTPHRRRPDLDLLLADWGIHHLHLGEVIEADGFATRSSDLLFVFFTPSDAYLIGIFDHGS